MSEWLAYTGSGAADDAAAQRPLPPPPPWRRFVGGDAVGAALDGRGQKYQVGPAEVEQVNAALYLRRPLLVTGGPGTGKSSLAHSVAEELGLGEVLRWPISSKATLRDGLYRYDAIGRLQEANFRDAANRAGHVVLGPLDIGAYIRLGPLGTALLPALRPRVLLIDELDKSDIDLPGDLLDVFEEGEYEIPELARLPAEQGTVSVMTADPDKRVVIERGQVRCSASAFPLVIITSNGEREFPAAFLRRCLRLSLGPADEEKLARIVEAHLGAAARDSSRELIAEFLSRREHGELATDQLLNAVFLRFSGLRPASETREQLAAALLPYLNRPAE
jgi:MoxR-like ATPase